MSKARNIIGWILAALITGFMCFSATAKLGLMDFPGKEEMFAAMGLTGNEPLIVGILEVLCAFLFLIPRTGVIGSLLISGYMGGVIATHLEHDNDLSFAIIFTIVIGITALIRYPELTTRITGKMPAPSAPKQQDPTVIE